MSLTVEAVVCLQAQGIDNKNGGIGKVRWDHGISDDDEGVGRGQILDDVSEGLEITTEVARIWGRQRKLRRRDESPE